MHSGKVGPMTPLVFSDPGLIFSRFHELIFIFNNPFVFLYAASLLAARFLSDLDVLGFMKISFSHVCFVTRRHEAVDVNCFSAFVPQVQGHREPDGHPDVQRRVLDVSESCVHLAAVRPAGCP